MADCDHCQHPLSDRRFYLDRTVEYFSYSGELQDGIPEHIQATVLECDSIKHFCCAGCAEIETPQVLHSLGLKILPPTIGPAATCAKCNGVVDMTAPHVSYSLMEATKIKQPWLTHLDVHNDEYLCVVCNQCDGQLVEAESVEVEEKVCEIA